MLINTGDFSKIEKHSVLGKIYTIIIILAPIVALYGIGISTVTLLDFVLIILNLIMCIYFVKRKKIRIYMYTFPFLIFLCISILFRMNNIDIMLRTLRYTLYIVNITFFVKNFFIIELALKIYKNSAILSTAYLLIQVFLSNLLGIYLSGTIKFLPLIASDLATYDQVFASAQIKRNMAFFAEPSHYAIFILGYLAINLFMYDYKKTNKNFYFISAFLSLGIVLSTSILGVLVMLTLWGIWFFINFKQFFLKPHVLIIVFSFVIIFFLLVQDSVAFNYVTNSAVFERQSAGRFDGYGFILNLDRSFLEEIFGVGMNNQQLDVYLPSYPIIIYYFGYLGLLVFLFSFLPYIKNIKKNVATGLLICLFGISIGSEILVGNFILIFMSIMIGVSSITRNGENNEKN